MSKELDKLEIVQKEAFTLKFTITDANGDTVDVSSAECALYVKESLGDSSYTFSKSDSDFIKTEGASGILKVKLSRSDFNINGEYYAEVLVIINSGNAQKKQFILDVEQSVESSS